MTINVRGYGAPSAKAQLAPYQFTRRDKRSDDVVIEILYCGICHTDSHSVNNDWGVSMYPIVPGHEIIGQVESVGQL
jgi:alcohol dehydrogenase (NADP+)